MEKEAGLRGQLLFYLWIPGLAGNRLLLVRSVVVTRLSLRSLVRVETCAALRASLTAH